MPPTTRPTRRKSWRRESATYGRARELGGRVAARAQTRRARAHLQRERAQRQRAGPAAAAERVGASEAARPPAAAGAQRAHDVAQVATEVVAAQRVQEEVDGEVDVVHELRELLPLTQLPRHLRRAPR